MVTQSQIQISIHSGEPVIVIDLSYYIFHRFFATQRWYSFRDKNAVENASSLCENQPFMDAYKKHFLQDLDKFRKKLAKKTKNPIIFLRDCPRSSIWRNEHIQDYKATRVVSNKLDSRIFTYTYEWLEETLVASKQATVAYVDNLEADDMAYLFKKSLRQVNPTQEIIIISNDNDYFQLYDDKCIIYNASLKNIKDRCKYGCPQKEKRCKILLGDKSDNIKPCLPTKYKSQIQTYLDMDDSAFQQFLIESQIQDKYRVNQRLVDLSYIPASLQEKCNEAYIIVHCT